MCVCVNSSYNGIDIATHAMYTQYWISGNIGVFPYVIMNLGKLAMWLCANTAKNFVIHGTTTVACSRSACTLCYVCMCVHDKNIKIQ